MQNKRERFTEDDDDASGEAPEPRTRRIDRTTIDNQFIDDFADLIRKGMPIDGCCDYLGLATATFWDWRTRGEKYLAGTGRSSWYLYGNFVMALRRATADYRMKIIEELHDHKNKRWRKQLLILERRDRANFGKREPSGGTLEQYDADEQYL